MDSSGRSTLLMMSSGSLKYAMFSDVVDICLPLCVVESELHF